MYCRLLHISKTWSLCWVALKNSYLAVCEQGRWNFLNKWNNHVNCLNCWWNTHVLNFNTVNLLEIIPYIKFWFFNSLSFVSNVFVCLVSLSIIHFINVLILSWFKVKYLRFHFCPNWNRCARYTGVGLTELDSYIWSDNLRIVVFDKRWSYLCGNFEAVSGWLSG